MASLHKLDQRLLDQRLTPMSPTIGMATVPRYNTEILSRFCSGTSRFSDTTSAHDLVRARSDLEKPAKSNMFWDADLQSYMYLQDFLQTNKDWREVTITCLENEYGKMPNGEPHSDYRGSLPQYMLKDELEKQITLILDLAPEREERFWEIIDQDDADGAVNYWLGMLRINPAVHPATYLMVRLGRRIGEYVVMCLKGYFRSPRPSQLCPAIIPMIEPPGTPTFPAGHAVQAYLMSYLLAYSLRNIPGQGGGASIGDGPLFKLAYRVSQNRIVAGVHFPIDIEAGKIVAGKCFELVQNVHSIWGDDGQSSAPPANADKRDLVKNALTYDHSLERESLRARVRQEFPQYA